METEVCTHCGGRGDTQRYDEFEKTTVIEPCWKCSGLGHHGDDARAKVNPKNAREAINAACRAFERALRRIKGERK